VKIAVDAMGGDYAPRELVRGTVAALQKQEDLEVLLVGRPEELEAELEACGWEGAGGIRIVPAQDVIAMDENPGLALRRKKEASVVVAARLVKEREAAAFVSAGNTGAAMGAALFQMGRIKGVARPAIASPFPTARGLCLLLDAGANADARPVYLEQFAHMGAIYAENVWGIPNPRVGLLNIGSEAEKGNELSRETYQLLARSSLNFVGNVEGRELPAGVVDVIICDGFVGNIILKLAEGLAFALMERLKGELEAEFRTRLGAALALPAFRRFKKGLDYQEYGGAPLLGVKGICIISHGSSKARAIENAIGAAVAAVQRDVVAKIQEKMRAFTGD
jgi:glycerol-3-phosphate acyltransferase PlsX